jgi:hypothetical protein
MTEHALIRSALPRFGRIPRDLLRDPSVPDRAKVLYGLLDDYAGATSMPFPKRTTLAKDLGCSVDTVDRAVAHLVDAGWVYVERRWRQDGGQSSNEYVLQAVSTRAAEMRPPRRTNAAPPAAPLRPQEGEPHEGDPEKTPQAPQRGEELDLDLGADPVNGPTTAPQTRRLKDVDDSDPHWAAFWEAYPRHTSKGAARKAWVKALGQVAEAGVLIRAAERVRARTETRIAELVAGGRSRPKATAEVMQFVPYPATWLNREQWSDEEIQAAPDARGFGHDGSWGVFVGDEWAQQGQRHG